MKIGIYLDKYSGHLFHDIELFIVLFEKIINNFKDKNTKYFLLKEKQINF